MLAAYIAPDNPSPKDATPLPGDPHDWDNQIRYAVSGQGLTDPLAPLLVKAIIDQETGGTWDPEVVGDYNPDLCPTVYAPHPYGNLPRWQGGGRVSTAGYCSLGLMQVNRYYHRVTGDLLSGGSNILIGTQILAAWWRQYPAYWRRAVAGYNGGEEAARFYPNVEPRVLNYVDAVESRLQVLALEAGIVVA